MGIIGMVETIIGLISIVGIVMILAGWVGCIVAIHGQDENWAFWSFVFDAVLLFGILRYWHEARNSLLVLLAGAGITGVGLLLNAFLPITAP